jgi:hypothetical protein
MCTAEFRPHRRFKTYTSRHANEKRGTHHVSIQDPRPMLSPHDVKALQVCDARGSSFLHAEANRDIFARPMSLKKSTSAVATASPKKRSSALNLRRRRQKGIRESEQTEVGRQNCSGHETDDGRQREMGGNHLRPQGARFWTQGDCGANPI